MARKPRIHFEGAIYHVTQRGVARTSIFLDEADRKRFLERLGEAAEDHGVRVYLFCLMPTHIHLVVETPAANLSAFMHRLLTAYTLYFNIRHGRSGHLMQGRFGAVPVQGDQYLLTLSRYVHLNPVKGGDSGPIPANRRAEKLRKYLWSSFRGYAGLERPWDFMEEGPLLAMMNGTLACRRAAYARFVLDGLAKSDAEWPAIEQSRWGWGDEGFLARVKNEHQNASARIARAEDVSFRHVANRLDPAQVLEQVAREYNVSVADLGHRGYRNQARAVALLMLVRHSGVSQRDAAAQVNLGTGAAVSQRLTALRKAMALDTKLARRIETLSDAMAGCKS